MIQIGLGTHDPADTPAFAFPKEISNIMNHESQIFFQLYLILLIVDLGGLYSLDHECVLCPPCTFWVLLRQKSTQNYSAGFRSRENRNILLDQQRNKFDMTFTIGIT